MGPIVAALFVTSWDIYGNAFKDLLPELKINKSVISLESNTTKKSVKKVLSEKKKKSVPILKK